VNALFGHKDGEGLLTADLSGNEMVVSIEVALFQPQPRRFDQGMRFAKLVQRSNRTQFAKSMQSLDHDFVVLRRRRIGLVSSREVSMTPKKSAHENGG
jgi:hypothetical protein